MYQPSKTAKLLAGAIVVALMTVVPAVLHGHRLNRWRLNPDIVQASELLTQLPVELGDWTKVGDNEPLQEFVQRELGVSDYIRGTYRNTQTGGQVKLLLLAGQPGPLVRHPPDICYAMSGNARIGQPGLWRINVAGDEHQFRVLNYRGSGALTGEFVVAYGFFDGAKWNAPRFPRLDYGGNSWLWKIQVLCSDTVEENEVVPKNTQAFLADFIQIVATRPTPSS